MSKKAAKKKVPESVIHIIGICLIVVFAFTASLYMMDSFTGSRHPVVSEEEFKVYEAQLDEAISISKKDKEEGMEALETLPFLPKSLENRKNFILGDLYQEDGNTAMAFVSFYSIDKSYLPKYSLWKLTMLAKKIGFEKIVLSSLDLLTSKFSKEAKFKYELAKSYLRQSQFKQAEELFSKVKKDFPESDYAIGSSFYLGNLSSDRKDKIFHFADYLKQSPEGSLAPLASNQLLALQKKVEKELEHTQEQIKIANEECSAAELAAGACQEDEELAEAKQLTSNTESLEELEIKLSELQEVQAKLKETIEHEIRNEIALSFFSAEVYEKAAKYFKTDYKFVEIDWHKHAQALYKLKRHTEARNLLKKKLAETSDDKKAREALEYFVQITPSWNRLNELRSLLSKAKVAQDKILWNIARRTDSKKDYEKVYTEYPDSYYAAESMARVFWKEYGSKDYNDALELAEKHWEQYPDTMSHDFVAFWSGKILFKKEKYSEAAKKFQRLIKEHPRSYYRYRAEAILNEDIEDTSKAKWHKLKPPSRLVNEPDWDWPAPYKDNEIKDKYGKDFLELIKIQQHETVLKLVEEAEKIAKEEDAKFQGDTKFKMWLYAKDGNHLKAISTAYFKIPHQAKTNLKDIKFSYAYPLLYNDLVTKESVITEKIDPLLAHALIKQESRYQPEIVSRVGAVGLMQLMPYTAKLVARRIKIKSPGPEDLRNPKINVKLGVSYMDEVLSTFDYNMIFTIASYNAGPNAVKRWNRKYGFKDPDLFVEQIPYNETRNYVKKVLSNYWIYQEVYKNSKFIDSAVAIRELKNGES